MPKQKGLIKFTGTLNGMCYYVLNGQYIVRKAAGPSKERINNDPAFANVKSNNQEFAAASKLSKAIRQGLGNTGKQFKDTYMASRLTGACRKIIQKGRGSLGQREANLHNAPTALIGFQLNKHIPLDYIYSAKPKVTANSNRTTITISIPKSSKNHLKQIPKNATHYQLTAAISIVSAYQWQPNTNTYTAVNPEQNAFGTTTQTQPILCKIHQTNLNLQLQIPNNTNIPSTAAITVWLGITYLKEQNNSHTAYKTPKAMQCIAII